MTLRSKTPRHAIWLKPWSFWNCFTTLIACLPLLNIGLTAFVSEENHKTGDISAGTTASRCQLVNGACYYHVTLTPACTATSQNIDVDKSNVDVKASRFMARLENIERNWSSVTREYSRRLDEVERQLTAALASRTASDSRPTASTSRAADVKPKASAALRSFEEKETNDAGKRKPPTPVLVTGTGSATGSSRDGVPGSTPRTKSTRLSEVFVNQDNENEENGGLLKRGLGRGVDDRALGGGLGEDEEGEITQTTLLNRVQYEFSNLRRELGQCRRRQRETESSLTTTKTKLTVTQREVNETNLKLLDAERKMATSAEKIQNLKDHVESARADRTAQTIAMENMNRSLIFAIDETFSVREELNAMKGRLETCRHDREERRSKADQTEMEYNVLKALHENMTLKATEANGKLTDCFKGKTSQFCGFEDPDICGFNIHGNLTSPGQTLASSPSQQPVWVRRSDKSPSTNSGPSVDHTCGNNKGYYMFADGTSMKDGQTARMISSFYYGTGDQCLQFFYHMKGRHIGTLNVYAVISDKEVSAPTWRAFGNQGDVWIMARLGIPAQIAEHGYQVAFEGIMTNGVAGDIAVDDVWIFNGNCSKT